MLATVTPFFVGQPASHLFNLNTMGLFDSPFPGFESLMMVGLGELLSDYMAATLILGLALSAGVPWLLTAMFLKPTQASRTQAGPEVAA